MSDRYTEYTTKEYVDEAIAACGFSGDYNDLTNVPVKKAEHVYASITSEDDFSDVINEEAYQQRYSLIPNFNIDESVQYFADIGTLSYNDDTGNWDKETFTTYPLEHMTITTEDGIERKALHGSNSYREVYIVESADYIVESYKYNSNDTNMTAIRISMIAANSIKLYSLDIQTLDPDLLPDTVATKEYVDDMVANVGSEEDEGSGLPLLSSILKKNEDGSLYKHNNRYHCLDFDLIPKDATVTYYDDISTKDVLYATFLLIWKDDNAISQVFGLRSTYPIICIGYRTSQQLLNFTNTFYSIDYNFETNEKTTLELYSLSSKPSTSAVLTKTNTTEYTPTADYHPATKKYVDEAVGNIESVDTNDLVVTNSISINRKEGATIGEKSVAVGNNVEASGYYSHAEGTNTKASGFASHAEGSNTEVSGYASHAEGHYSEASGDYSHAEGFATTASGDYSHAEGARTIASSEYQHVQGRFNIEDSTNTYAHIVGNGEEIETDEGTQTICSNAHTLDWDGNGWFAGDLYVGGTSQDDAQKLATETYVDNKLNGLQIAQITQAEYDALETKDPNTLYLIVG